MLRFKFNSLKNTLLNTSKSLTKPIIFNFSKSVTQNLNPTFLRASSSYINHSEIAKQKALMSAIRHGQTDVVKRLIKEADLNPKITPSRLSMLDPYDNMPPLATAAIFGNPEIVSLLLSHGADVNSLNQRGWAPLMYLIDYASGLRFEKTPPHGEYVLNIQPHLMEIAKLLLNAPGMNINLKMEPLHQTVLMHASSYRPETGPACMRFKAIQKTNKEIISLLLNDKNIKINEQNRYGETALMHAVQSNNLIAVQLLLKHGADIDIKNNRGETALSLITQIVDSHHYWNREPLRIQNDHHIFVLLATFQKTTAQATRSPSCTF